MVEVVVLVVLVLVVLVVVEVVVLVVQVVEVVVLLVEVVVLVVLVVVLLLVVVLVVVVLVVVVVKQRQNRTSPLHMLYDSNKMDRRKDKHNSMIPTLERAEVTAHMFRDQALAYIILESCHPANIRNVCSIIFCGKVNLT